MMLYIFSYWTYMGMEILKKNVAFFQLLDLYGYGNLEKKCCFFLAIGLIWVWTYKGMVQVVTFFGCKVKSQPQKVTTPN